MLITVYELVNRKFQTAKQFYWWRVPILEELKETGEYQSGRSRIKCPGCGKEYSRAVIRYEHECRGTLTGDPVPYHLFKSRLGRPPRNSPEARQKLKEYISRQKHPVVFDQNSLTDHSDSVTINQLDNGVQ